MSDFKGRGETPGVGATLASLSLARKTRRIFTFEPFKQRLFLFSQRGRHH